MKQTLLGCAALPPAQREGRRVLVQEARARWHPRESVLQAPSLATAARRRRRQPSTAPGRTLAHAGPARRARCATAAAAAAAATNAVAAAAEHVQRTHLLKRMGVQGEGHGRTVQPRTAAGGLLGVLGVRRCAREKRGGSGRWAGGRGHARRRVCRRKAAPQAHAQRYLRSAAFLLPRFP